MTDPNTQRALEQLAYIIGDVEQRIGLVKSALSQVLVHPGALPPTLGAERAMIPGLLGGLVGQQIPSWPGVVGAPLGVPTSSIPTGSFAPFQGGQPGVNAPFGFPTGFPAAGYPFRF